MDDQDKDEINGIIFQLRNEETDKKYQTKFDTVIDTFMDFVQENKNFNVLRDSIESSDGVLDFEGHGNICGFHSYEISDTAYKTVFKRLVKEISNTFKEIK